MEWNQKRASDIFLQHQEKDKKNILKIYEDDLECEKKQFETKQERERNLLEKKQQMDRNVFETKQENDRNTKKTQLAQKQNKEREEADLKQEIRLRNHINFFANHNEEIENIDSNESLTEKLDTELESPVCFKEMKPPTSI